MMIGEQNLIETQSNKFPNRSINLFLKKTGDGYHHNSENLPIPIKNPNNMNQAKLREYLNL